MKWTLALVLVVVAAVRLDARQAHTATSTEIVNGELRSSDPQAPLAFRDGAETLLIRNSDQRPRVILLPLRTADLSTTLRTPGGKSGLPEGGEFKVCPYGSRLCAYWELPAGKEIRLPMAVIRANSGDVMPGVMFIVDSEGSMRESRFRFRALPIVEPNRVVELDGDGFTITTTASGPAEVKIGTGLNERALTEFQIVNRHRVDFDVYAELGLRPETEPERQAFNAIAGAQIVDCPGRPGMCAKFSVPRANGAPGSVSVPVSWTDTFVRGSVVRLTARVPGNVIPANPDLYVRASGAATQSTAPTAGRARRSQPIGANQGFVVPLDNSGVADWDFLNPRNPPVLSPSWVLSFENRTADRTFVIAVPVNVLNAPELKTEGCRHVEGRCVILTVSPGTNQTISARAMTDAQRPVVRFALMFFNDTVPPAYPTGYVRTSTAPYESPSRATWSLLGNLSGTTQPEFAKDDSGQEPRITEGTPFEGHRTSSYGALARLNVKPTLGERADADVDLLFRQGTIGGQDPRVATGLRTDLDPVNVPKYLFNIYAVHGLQFSFGKTAFLETTLLTEAGEGFKFSYRNFGVTHILKRESAERIATRDNDDHSVWIAQANNLLTTGLGSLRGVTLTGVYGEDQKPDPDVERKYWSGELDVFFGVPSINVQGSVSVAHSRRMPETATAKNRRAEGTVAFATGTWSHVKPGVGFALPQLQRSVGLTLAQGSTDLSNTDDIDEGFMGESARFGPDVLFLSSFAPRLGPLNGTSALIPAGLANKSYLAITYTEETFSLLEWAASLLRVPPSDVVSRRTIVRFHRYRFRESIFDVRDAGNELSIDFAVETPKGVRTALSIARFLPSSGLNRFFKVEPWRVAAFIQVQM